MQLLYNPCYIEGAMHVRKPVKINPINCSINVLDVLLRVEPVIREHQNRKIGNPSVEALRYCIIQHAYETNRIHFKNGSGWHHIAYGPLLEVAFPEIIDAWGMNKGNVGIHKICNLTEYKMVTA